MKRLVIIVFLILALLLVLFFGAPLFLKSKLRNVASNSLRKYFNGSVEVASVDVAVWQNFPNLDIEWKDILVKGNEPDRNDTLLWVGSVRTSTSVRAVFLPSDIEIASLKLDGVRLNLNERSFAKRRKKEVVQKQTAALISTGSSKSVHLNLRQVSVKNADLDYTVLKNGMEIRLNGISADLSGEIPEKTSGFDLKIQAEELKIGKGDRHYLSTGSIAFSSQLEPDYTKKTLRLKNGLMDVQGMPIRMDGTVSAPGDSVYFDLGLEGTKTGFGEFLALFPALSQNVLKNFSPKGTAEIKGRISGYYFGNEYPAINLDAMVSDASLQYPGMPSSVDKLKAGFKFLKPQGVFDSTQISISEAHAEIGKNPVDFNLKMVHPFSDPEFDGILIGKINLTDFQNIYPLEDVLLYGDVDVNLLVQGKYSDLLAKDYSQLQSDGVMWLHNVQYSSPKLTRRISIPEAKLNFAPEKLDLQKLVLQIGQSDFLISGGVQNYLDYLLNNGTLEADLQLNSRFINLNQLIQLKNVEAGLSASALAGPAPDDLTTSAFKVPSRVNVKFRSNIEQAVFKQMLIENVRGNILVQNQKMILQDLRLNMLDGSLKMNGSYENTEQAQPLFDVGFTISDFDIPTMARTLDGFRKMVPGSENSSGRLHAELQLKGRFDEKLNLISESASGTGKFGTKKLVIVNSPLFRQLGGIIKKEKLQRVDVGDFTAELRIDKGNVQLLPFETRVMGQSTKVSGILSAESMLEMQLDFMVDRSVIGNDIQNILAVIPGNEKIKQLPASVKIDGPTSNPKVHPDLSVTTKAVADATKDDLKNTLDKLGKSIFKFLK